MDLTVQRALKLDDVLPGFNLKPANATDSPGDLSNGQFQYQSTYALQTGHITELYSTIAYAIDSQLSPDSGMADTKWHRSVLLTALLLCYNFIDVHGPDYFTSAMPIPLPNPTTLR